VLAYLRRGIGEDGLEDIMLCVNNLSRFHQPVELMLAQLAGKVPIEATGRVRFPSIGELPYFVTLAPYGFYWFELVDPPEAGM
jgi:maltose alpha-D-glucosyltransferase/alpha-amylase